MTRLPIRRIRGRFVSPFDELREEMNRVFNGFLPGSVEQGNQFDWAPPVDIAEDENNLTVTSELPGMNKEDVEIEVANGILTIKGEKKTVEEDETRAYHHREVRYGSFSRSFTLPVDVKTEDVKASFKDGVLSISFPKEEKALHKKIEIES